MTQNEDSMVPLCLSSIEDLIEEIEKRGTLIMGLVTNDALGEEVHFFVRDHVTDVTTTHLAEGLLERVKALDDEMNTDFDKLERIDPWHPDGDASDDEDEDNDDE